MNRLPQDSLMHLQGSTFHARKGAVKNAFRYGVDFVLIDPSETKGRGVFSRNRFNLFSVHDRHHGGARGAGSGAIWARRVFCNTGLDGVDLRLLTQPTWLGVQFNPVSFWLAYRDGYLHGVIAEVNNTFGDRHSYLCVKPDLGAICPTDRILAYKTFHVSPFQYVAGQYEFAFDIRPDEINIQIDFSAGKGGLFATLDGRLRPMSQARLLGASLRRPFGAARVLALIFYQAAKLKIKGATYRNRPAPPTEEIS